MTIGRQLFFPLLICLLGACAAQAKDTDQMRVLREKMVTEQIVARGVYDQNVLSAMRAIPRHLFVPEREERLAYEDHAVPIGYGQTISQPYIVAYMTQMAQVKPDFRVLEIGAGSGYQAAVLAQMVKHVYTVEIIPELAQQAQARLQDIGYDNISIKNADGYHGWSEHAPFDVIVVTAAASHIPPPLIDQLKDGGRMIIPVGTPYLVQMLVLVIKNGDQIRTQNLQPVRFVPLTRG